MAYSLSDSQSMLKKAMKDIEGQWSHAGTAWNDKAREEFDKQHLEVLRVAVANAGHSMSNIDQILRHVMRECE
ncbi:MAG: hypothetical protein WCT04_09810 [Planctomycetota bacterium]